MWLVAQPLNAVLALAATSALLYLGFLSSMIVVLLVLHQGARAATVKVLLAGALLAAVSLLAGARADLQLTAALVNWLPALLLALLLNATRSLTLTLQLSVIFVVIAMVGFIAIVGNPVEFWQTIVVAAAEVWRDMGLHEQADRMLAEQEAIATQMTSTAAVAIWTVYAGSLILGYLLYRELPGETREFGRFSDLNFGRVIASIMALASVLALLTGVVWIQNVAFLMFAVFWLQGLAIVHWLKGAGLLPVFALVAVYVLLLLLNVLLAIALAVLGYIDAWFHVRRVRPAR
jgi:hypothetical protein